MSLVFGWGALSALSLHSIQAQAPEGNSDEAAAVEGAGTERGSLVEDRAAMKLIEAGDARLSANEPAKALEIWQSVIERYPRSRHRFLAHMKLGKELLARERAIDRARSHFEAAVVEENSDDDMRAEAALKIGVCYFEARNYGRAFQELRKVIESFPSSGFINEAHYYIGMAHFQLGHYSRAIEALDKVGAVFASGDGTSARIEAGKRFFIRIEDADLAVLDVTQSVPVVCETTHGDKETIPCLPIGRNVRVVLGSIGTNLGTPTPGNGNLEVRGDDKVRVSYVDAQTSDRTFDRPVLLEATVVGQGVVEMLDGAYQESLSGVVLGKPIHVQVTDFDQDLSPKQDRVRVLIEVFRHKTQAEIDAELAEATAKASPMPPADPNDPPADPDLEKPEVKPEDELVLFDKFTAELLEAEVEAPGTDKETGALTGTPGGGTAAPPVTGPNPSFAKNTAANKTAENGTPADKTATSNPAANNTAANADAKKEASKAEPAKEKSKQKSGKSSKTKKKSSNKKPKEPAAEAVVPLVSSGIFRGEITLTDAETANLEDAQLQSQTGYVVKITYQDERNLGEGVRTVASSAQCVTGNLGAVRVTRSEVADQELRLRTQLKTASALTNIGDRYKEFGLKKNAQDKYRQALEVCEAVSNEAMSLGGSLLEETYVQLWKVYFAMDELEVAAAMAQRLQQEFPKSDFVDDAMLQLAEVARKQGDFPRAIGLYSRLVEMKESDLRGEAQFGVAECYEAMSRLEQGPAAAQLLDRAFNEYRGVYENFPESGRVGEAVAKMAVYYVRHKDFARAIDTFETVLTNHPDARFLDVIHYHYGLCLVELKRTAEARQQFDQLLSDFPDSKLAGMAKKISDALGKVSPQGLPAGAGESGSPSGGATSPESTEKAAAKSGDAAQNTPAKVDETNP